MKTIAVYFLALGVVTILYGNIASQHIIGCEKQGVREEICTAAEWDTEKVNLLPQYNPENIKAIAALRSAADKA